MSTVRYREWLEQAERDLVLAKTLIDPKCEFLEWACFAAQQAAEKAAKAVKRRRRRCSLARSRNGSRMEVNMFQEHDVCQACRPTPPAAGGAAVGETGGPVARARVRQATGVSGARRTGPPGGP
jgi:hypothetical protein